MQDRRGFLVLEDGMVFSGTRYGMWGPARGEVVVNTSMTGYEALITDPASAGQILVFTYPMFGNYGFALPFAESSGPQVAGLVLAEVWGHPSHWTNNTNADQYLRQHRIPALAGVDTRALAKHLRVNGSMPGRLVHSYSEGAQSSPVEIVCDLSPRTCAPYLVNDDGEWRVTVVDLGLRKSLLTALTALGARIYVTPPDVSAQEVLETKPEAVIYSSGSESVLTRPMAVATASSLLPLVPQLGLGVGHMLLALAGGATSYKLPSGHRGMNYPVTYLPTGRTTTTTQNHGHAVSLTTDSPWAVTHINVNDGSIEGLAHSTCPAFGIQFDLPDHGSSDDPDHPLLKLKALSRLERGA